MSINKTNGFFGVICLLAKTSSGEMKLLNDSRLGDTVLNWIDYDNRSLILFNSTLQIEEQMDCVLPKMEISVKDCNYTLISTNCTLADDSKECQKTTYPIVFEYPDKRRANQCPESVTMECSCEDVKN